MTATLAQAIESSAVGMDDLHRDYRPMLAMVNELIGVVPNCDQVLEIWPPGFRTYNLFVPNLLNLPVSLFGQGAPKDLVGLAMYASSRAAECMYCAAHTCSFALRRGASPDAITGTYNEAERAVADMAEAMSTVPGYLTRAHVEELRKFLDQDQLEWVVLSVAMMGFLNKFMDTMGIELEEAAIEDVSELIGPTGWEVGKHGWTTELEDTSPSAGRPLRRSETPAGDGSFSGRMIQAKRADGEAGGNNNGSGGRSYRTVPIDSFGTYLRVLRNAPGAIRKERQWTRGVSSRVGPTLIALEDRVGYSFPILASLNQNRAVKAVAAALRTNLDPDESVAGMDVKLLAGLVYARVVGNEMLTAEAVQLTELLAPQISPSTLAAVSRFAQGDLASAQMPTGLTREQAAAVLLARAASPSPSEVNEITVALAVDALTPAQIVEIVVWISVQQLLHRLYLYYDAVNEISD